MTTSAPPPPTPATERPDRGDDPEADLPILRSLKEQDQKTSLQAGGIVGALAALVLTQLVPGSGWLFVVLAAPFAIGVAVGRYALRGRAGIRSVASWTGLVAWLLPIFGMLVSGAVFAGQDPARPIMRERILAGVVFVFSVANSVIGVLLKRP